MLLHEEKTSNTVWIMSDHDIKCCKKNIPSSPDMHQVEKIAKNVVEVVDSVLRNNQTSPVLASLFLLL